MPCNYLNGRCVQDKMADVCVVSLKIAAPTLLLITSLLQCPAAASMSIYTSCLACTVIDEAVACTCQESLLRTDHNSPSLHLLACFALLAYI
jgi:hypothetical protein